MPPSFFSWEFHTRFFPALFRAHISSDSKNREVFVPHNYIQAMAAIFLFIILLVVGIVSPPGKQLAGSVWTILGTAGIITVCIYSVYMHRNIPPSYNSFLFGVFGICIVFGITAGIFITAINWHTSLPLRVAGGLAGLIVGYGTGIWGGLYSQRLGFIIYIFEALAVPVMIGMIVLDILLMFAW